jgi:hypothetical protein
MQHHGGADYRAARGLSLDAFITSDRGSQYASAAYREMIAADGFER